MNHTPGPWKIREMRSIGHAPSGYSIVHYSEAIAALREVCKVRFKRNSVESHESVSYFPHPHDEANAHLIAAAPELLEALKALRDAVKAEPAMNNMKYDGLGIQVNRAIAKAERKA